MAMPDKIEDVDAEQLISIVETDPFVTGKLFVELELRLRTKS